MKPCKRVEIVIEEPMVPRLIKVLREIGVPGYTAIPNMGGAGDRGVRRGDELAGDSSNTLFIIACDDDALVDSIIEGVRPLLRRSGGICLVSDALWLRH
ncbi:MAG: nitrogen regulatory protein PII [Halieaceae bacterium]|jgi:nitrogen regulatory protein PII